MQADGRQLQFARERPPVQRLDIHQLVHELVWPGLDLVVGQGVKHERIIGIRAMPDADQGLFSSHHQHSGTGNSEQGPWPFNRKASGSQNGDCKSQNDDCRSSIERGSIANRHSAAFSSHRAAVSGG
jgi:hypothetical protein